MAYVHPTVLVVDDDEEREPLAQSIRANGYEVVTAENGRDALGKLRAGAAPCIMVVDLVMPEMDGFEFRRLQLADPALQFVPVVVYSTAETLSDYADLLDVAGFLRKPSELAPLMALIREHCLK